MMTLWGLFLANAALAAGDWHLVSSNTFEARDAGGIQALLDRFPQAFGTGEAAGVEYLSVVDQRFRWEGKTICRPDDPRLEQRVTDGEIRYKPDASGGSGSGMTSTGMSVGDPCAEDLPPDGRWVLDGEKRAEFRSGAELAQYLSLHQSSFPEARPGDLEFASQVLQHYHWEGRTLCAPGDARLSLEEDDGVVKFKNDSGALGSPQRHESVRDPCGNG